MATKKQTNKLTKDKVDKIVDAVEDKVEKIVDIVENKVEDAKEAAQKVKKTTAKKEIKTSLFVEYYGKQVEDKTIIAAVKKAWTKSGNKIGDIKTMDLYIKPEDDAVYFVINKTESGSVEF